MACLCSSWVHSVLLYSLFGLTAHRLLCFFHSHCALEQTVHFHFIVTVGVWDGINRLCWNLTCPPLPLNSTYCTSYTSIKYLINKWVAWIVWRLFFLQPLQVHRLPSVMELLKSLLLYCLANTSLCNTVTLWKLGTTTWSTQNHDYKW